jgi:hypothetical protein
MSKCLLISFISFLTFTLNTVAFAYVSCGNSGGNKTCSKQGAKNTDGTYQTVWGKCNGKGTCIYNELIKTNTSSTIKE